MCRELVDRVFHLKFGRPRRVRQKRQLRRMGKEFHGTRGRAPGAEGAQTMARRHRVSIRPPSTVEVRKGSRSRVLSGNEGEREIVIIDLTGDDQIVAGDTPQSIVAGWTTRPGDSANHPIDLTNE